jgi:hypothetical protein
MDMEDQEVTTAPTHCPVCGQDLLATRLECSSCGTEVTGRFTLGRLASLREPHASLLEMFLRVRGNVKEMERELGLSYPTVRARLEEAFTAAGFEKPDDAERDPIGDMDLGEAIRSRVEEALANVNLEDRIRSRVEHGLSRAAEAQGRMHRVSHQRPDLSQERKEILDRLERGEIEADEAAQLLRELKDRRP